MKTLKWTLAGTAMAALLALGAPVQAQSAAHDHGSAAPHELTLNQGRKWSTDAPLRKGMDNIRGLVAPKLQAAHAGTLQPAQYRELAGQVEQQVAFIVQNCKLAPDADAQLHLLIADIGSGVDAMNGKTAGTQAADGLLRVTQALNQYQTHFDHPGFLAVPVAH
ncbi:MAG TPA: hypothetical protein PKB14_25295 [Rubrivivax sp.]|nr:hypothetical protein [Rubrivivax sp.]